MQAHVHGFSTNLCREVTTPPAWPSSDLWSRYSKICLFSIVPPINQTNRFRSKVKHDRETHDHRESEFAGFSSRRLNYGYPRGSKFPRFPASFPTKVSAHRPTYARLGLSSISLTRPQRTLFWDADLYVPWFNAVDPYAELSEIEKGSGSQGSNFTDHFDTLSLVFLEN